MKEEDFDVVPVSVPRDSLSFSVMVKLVDPDLESVTEREKRE